MPSYKISCQTIAFFIVKGHFFLRNFKLGISQVSLNSDKIQLVRK